LSKELNYRRRVHILEHNKIVSRNKISTSRIIRYQRNGLLLSIYLHTHTHIYTHNEMPVLNPHMYHETSKINTGCTKGIAVGFEHRPTLPETF
jgi:hypothetical protein